MGVRVGREGGRHASQGGETLQGQGGPVRYPGPRLPPPPSPPPPAPRPGDLPAPFPVRGSQAVRGLGAHPPSATLPPASIPPSIPISRPPPADLSFRPAPPQLHPCPPPPTLRSAIVGCHGLHGAGRLPRPAGHGGGRLLDQHLLPGGRRGGVAVPGQHARPGALRRRHGLHRRPGLLRPARRRAAPLHPGSAPPPLPNIPSPYPDHSPMARARASESSGELDSEREQGQ